MSAIELRGLGKSFPNGEAAVRGLDLTVADGELLVLVGPSGCGKSTTLRLVAGLESPSAGRITLGERDVTDVPPQERNLAMVFQSYALYPHRTVRQNLEFPLRMRGVARERMAERVMATARTLGIEALLDRRPGELSGGQRQRVALGRAMVREPEAFLLDEPLSNLDVQLRVQTRAELARVHRRLGATMLYVTHDQEEAMTLGDRIAVMRDGRLLQVATPEEIYRRPADTFVAGFIGSPAMNLLRVTRRMEAGATTLAADGFELHAVPVPAEAPEALWLGVRPHDVSPVDPGEGDVTGTVEVSEFLGSEVHLHVRLPGADGPVARLATPAGHPAVRLGAPVGLRLRRDRLHLFAHATGQRVT